MNSGLYRTVKSSLSAERRGRKEYRGSSLDFITSQMKVKLCLGSNPDMVVAFAKASEQWRKVLRSTSQLKTTVTWSYYYNENGY